MAMLLKCRICISEDVQRHQVVNTKLQEIYEKLTSIPFVARDSRPTQVCYSCYEKLENCYQLRDTCLKSEKLFTQMLNNNGLKPTPLQHINKPQTVNIPRINITFLDEMELDDEGINDDDDDDIIRPLIIVENVQEISKGPVTHDTSNKSDSGGTLDSTIQIIKGEDDTIFEITEINTDDDMNIRSNEDSIPKDNSITKTQQVIESVQKSSQKSSSKENNKNIKCKINKNVKEKQTTNKKCANKDIQSKCDMCKKDLHQKIDLSKHSCVVKDKKYKCEQCEKSFKRKGHLTKHIRTHTGEKPYKCDICERAFNCTSNLKSHRRVHTGDKRFQCDMCQKYFILKHDLMKHIRTHTGERPYKCLICEKYFTCDSNLLRHMRIHSGAKPYQCDICEKRFRQKDHLSAHTRIHTGEKPYQCNICEKSFSQHSNLIGHRLMHK